MLSDTEAGLPTRLQGRSKVRSAMSEACTKITALDLRKEGFGLLRDSGRQYPMGVALEGKGVQESWSVFKRNLLKAREGSI